MIEQTGTRQAAELVASYLDSAIRRLSQAGIRQAHHEVNVLAAIAGEDRDLFQTLVDKRRSRVPLEHLTGLARFREIDLFVGPGVFVPQPETGCLVQWAVDSLRRVIAGGQRNPLCVDLCTGSGTIALSVASEVPDAVVHAVEVDPGALEWAALNEAHHGFGVTFHAGDFAHALPELDGQFDLVMSNPPYVATGEMAGVRPEVRDHDPTVALQAGADGLDVIRQIERTARRLVKRGGFVVVEHSDRQGSTAPEIFRSSGVWRDVKDHRDHDLLDRFVTAERR